MSNVNDRQLSFPQRNWILMCIVVAILSPLVVDWVRAGAHKQSYQQSIDIKPPSNNAGVAAGGGSDTSNKVAAPPVTDTGKNAANK
jgi:hypothetical protein